MSDSVLKTSEGKMKKSIDSLARELASIRTGAANSSMLDRVNVEYYGAPTPLNQLASISIPEARMLVVTPYDKSSVDSVLKAIQMADLGVNPTSDGTLIRISVPQLTEDRRKEFVKDARKEGENAKVAIRNVRRDSNDELKASEKKGNISEDELRNLTDSVQKLTDKYIAEVDTMCDAKEKDILEV